MQNSVEKINSFIDIYGEEAYGEIRKDFDEKSFDESLNASDDSIKDLIIQVGGLLAKEEIVDSDRVLLKRLNNIFYQITRLIDEFEKKH